VKFFLIFSIFFASTFRSYGNDSLTYYLTLGKNAYDQKKFEEAIGYYNNVLDIDSDFYAARFERGMAYASIQRLEDAIADFTACVNLFPKDKNAYFQRGILKATRFDYEGALMDFKMCSQLDPTDSETWLYIEYCKLNLHGF